MFKALSALLVFALVFFPVSSVYAQSPRMRVSNQFENNIPTPQSFRGGDSHSQQGQGKPGAPNIGAMLGTGAQGDAAMAAMGYQVHVLGEVQNPGTFRVLASDRVSEVIGRAGGVVQNGSQRNIELRRKGGGTINCDLLLYKQRGELNQNPYVTDNDTIFVPLRKNIIQVVGSVKRPDYYELRKEKNLSDVIALAGGFNAATAYKEPMRIVRFVNGEKQVEEVAMADEQMRHFSIQNGDVVVVGSVVTQGTKFDYNLASVPGDQIFYPSYEDRVFVLGGVASPGAYEFSPYYTINQYVSLSGGLNDRGKKSYLITSVDGKTHKAKAESRVNPGDTIMVKQSWMSSPSWVSFILGIASFGLSTSTTILALERY